MADASVAWSSGPVLPSAGLVVGDRTHPVGPPRPAPPPDELVVRAFERASAAVPTVTEPARAGEPEPRPEAPDRQRPVGRVWMGHDRRNACTIRMVALWRTRSNALRDPRLNRLAAGLRQLEAGPRHEAIAADNASGKRAQATTSKALTSDAALRSGGDFIPLHDVSSARGSSGRTLSATCNPLSVATVRVKSRSQLAGARSAGSRLRAKLRAQIISSSHQNQSNCLRDTGQVRCRTSRQPKSKSRDGMVASIIRGLCLAKD